MRYIMSESREELQIQIDKLRKIRIDLEMSRKALSKYIGIPLRNLKNGKQEEKSRFSK
jgi:DNA-binding transcriptional regulator YiaG